MRRTFTQLVVLMFVGLLLIGGINIAQNLVQNFQKAVKHSPTHKHILSYD